MYVFIIDKFMRCENDAEEEESPNQVSSDVEVKQNCLQVSRLLEEEKENKMQNYGKRYLK
jgi:hypothetical protein